MFSRANQRSCKSEQFFSLSKHRRALLPDIVCCVYCGIVVGIERAAANCLCVVNGSLSGWNNVGLTPELWIGIGHVLIFRPRNLVWFLPPDLDPTPPFGIWEARSAR